jgi:hypothetical protein
MGFAGLSGHVSAGLEGIKQAPSFFLFSHGPITPSSV